MCRSARLIRDHEQGVVLEARLGSAPERSVRALFNLGERPFELSDDAQMGQRLLFSSEAEAYRGERTHFDRIDELLPHECVVFGPSSWRTFT